MSLDTAWSERHKNSERRQCGGGPSCRRSREERCIPGRGRRLQIRTLRRQGTRFAATSPLRRSPGLTGRPHTSDLLCSGEEHGNAASQGGDRRRVAEVRLQQTIAATELPRTEGGMGTGGCERNAAQRPPPTAGHGFQLPHLTPGTGFAKSRRGVEKPKGTAQREIVARGRSSRRALQGRIVSISATEAPRGRLRSVG